MSEIMADYTPNPAPEPAPDEGENVRRDRKFMDCPNYLSYVELVGVTRTAADLGVSSTSVNNNRKSGRCLVAQEIAATYFLEKLTAPEPPKTQHILLLQLTPAQHAEIFPIIVSLRLRHADLTDLKAEAKA